MPKLFNEINIPGVQANDLQIITQETLKKIGAENIQVEIKSNSPFSGKISSYIPSIWGWGILKMDVLITAKENTSILRLEGFIAQLVTGPLRKKMREFTKELVNIINQKYGQVVDINQKEKKFFRQWTRVDTKMVIFVLIGVTVLALSEAFRIPGIRYLVGIIIIPLIYYFVRSYYNRKN